MKKVFLAIIAMLMMTNISAQNLSSVLKSAASAAVNDVAKNATSKVTTNVLGTAAVNASSLATTWKYSKPCAVYESSNVLENVAVAAVTPKVQSSMQSGLAKMGITAGKISMTFKTDKTGSVTCNGQTFPFNWSVKGATLTITLTSSLVQNVSKSFTMNVKETSGKQLQIAMSAEKLVNFMNAISKNATYLNSLTSLAKNVQGLYLGMEFTN